MKTAGNLPARRRVVTGGQHPAGYTPDGSRMV